MVNLLKLSEYAPLLDILGYEVLDNNSKPNLLLHVNRISYAIMKQSANLSYTYEEYEWAHRYSSFVDPSKPDVRIPFPKNSNRILFTGIKDSCGKWIKRASPKTQDAYIKFFFLIEFLVDYLKLNNELYTEDFCKTLCIDKTTFQKILWRLYQDNLLYVDTRPHHVSVMNQLSSSSYQRYLPYEYKIENTVSSSGYMLNPNKQSYIYNREDSYKFSPVTACPPAIFSGAGGTPEMKTEDSPQQYLIIDYCLTDYLHSLINLYDKNLSYEIAKPILSSIIIPRFKHLVTKNESEDCFEEEYFDNEENKHYERLPFKPYIAPYEDLEFRANSRDIMLIGKIDSLDTWEKKHSRKAYVTVCGRLWHPFHSLGREYRKFVYYNCSPLVEAFDISNCFYTLLFLKVLLEDNIPILEKTYYYNFIRKGIFYDTIVNLVTNEYFTRRCNVSEKTPRDIIKENAQAYRNSKVYAQAKYQYPEIDLFFSYFPSIRKMLFNNDMIINRKGKEVKRLQYEMCRIETYIISVLCYDLLSYGVTPFSLHDGVYLSESDMERMRDYLKLETTEDVKTWMKELFWEKFDTMPDEMTKELICWDKACCV
ncbi:hypothetical protein CIK96_04850 [Prevotella sp. P4-98]|uniref:hypothetical protein n=1 Tax=Prevotella sp. P4-98 TaxID=2024219 RepID=UPI000B96F40F|nr:hypothetical protein [Prevotella sp. P4-98]OYP46866.1 hypothetical protein CIK96_04850 [Prevotella sp. P4-98]